MKESWVMTPPSFTANSFGTWCSSLCLCLDGKLFDIHWRTHKRTPFFLEKQCLYFSHPWQENTGLNEDWITKPCEAFSWPQSLHTGIHFPFSLAPGLWLEPRRDGIGLPVALVCRVIKWHSGYCGSKCHGEYQHTSFVDSKVKKWSY